MFKLKILKIFKKIILKKMHIKYLILILKRVGILLKKIVKEVKIVDKKLLEILFKIYYQIG